MTFSSSPRPRRGEVWLVNLDPAIGAEIKKTRPMAIVSSDALGRLPLKLAVPLTEWKDQFQGNVWHVRINPTRSNGLSKPSAADTLQMRSVDYQRFVQRLGVLTSRELSDIVAAIAALVEYV